VSDSINISPVGPLDATIRPPGSKSITNRALVCAALAEGPSTLSGALASEDTAVMVQSLKQLGVEIEHDPQRATIHVVGCNGKIPSTHVDLFVANSGTTVRFLTAMTTLGRGRFRLDGIERMRERPIGDLLAALKDLGANAQSEHQTGCPPVVVMADGLPGGRTSIRGDVSSQFLSGLLMIAPYAQRGVQLSVEGPLVSRPYVAMTLAVMKSFGVIMQEDALERFVVSPDHYTGRTYCIEPDASAASYFFAAAAITGGRVTVEGLSRESLQGDVKMVECLEAMGCQVECGEETITVVGAPLRGVTVDMNAISDTAQTLAAVALFAEGPTTITGIGHNRHKETDRIGDLAVELRRLGATVEEHDDGMTITPGPLRATEINTYNDHRMAMSLALVGLRTPGVVINDPGCTEKTYPRFFQDLAGLRQAR
jgi:3-phosphoshikimate 1-carboxyvinyltransferase